MRAPAPPADRLRGAPTCFAPSRSSPSSTRTSRYYLIDDLGTGWWLIDVVYAVLVDGGGLNQHLSFLGVAVFMMLTGLMLTASATRHSPGRFLFNRVGRLLPALWVAIALAILLVRLGVNGMFSGQDGVIATSRRR